ncbi:MAG: amidophosphoribosyltransferase [Phototrophicales bacterium]|nr:MAG: amidophosphoribosyltransferase [Phototrophicales bacterium]
MQAMSNVDFIDKPQEECGVFGIYAPGRDVARLSFFGLYALQHRGQESAGIVTCDGQRAYIHKGMGLVSQVFNEENLAPLVGHMAIAHNRYSTTGGAHLRNVQPYLIETLHGPLALSHNGNLTNALSLRHMLLQRGVGLTSTADTEIMTQILASPSESWADQGVVVQEETDDIWIGRIRALMQLADGAYSLAILTRHALYAVRDPYGLRPLCLGKLPEGYVIASESCALGTIGAEYLRYVQHGEIIRINTNGITSFEGHPAKRRSLCSFEYVYFARPDSLLDGQVVHKVRQQMGRQLAIEQPAEADIVIGVPDSATPAAIGYAAQSGIQYSEGLTKNRYIGRTFIQPDDTLRKQSVNLKYNALISNLEGKRVVLVDDSIVRGNTAAPLIQLLRDGGAKEVHMRVSSPPVKHPCFMGVDMATYEQLIAATHSIEEIQAKIGADSLGYLSLEGMLKAIREGVGIENTYCTACFNGDYPVHIPEWLFETDRDKFIFEESWG